MKFLERLKTLFGQKTVTRAPQTDPTKPNFDIRAWMTEVEESRKQNPDHPLFQEMEAVSQGSFCCVTPEQHAEQQRQRAERQCQEEEAKCTQTNPHPRIS